MGGSQGSWRVAGFVGGFMLSSWVVWWLWFSRIGGCGLLELWFWVVGIAEIDLLEFWVVEIGLVFAGIVGQFAGLLKSFCWNCGLLKLVCWNCWNWLGVSSGFVGSTSPVIGSWGCGCGGRGGLYLDRPMVCVACVACDR